jgi:16S rRNA (guanine527-N7)-methyltransferase
VSPELLAGVLARSQQLGFLGPGDLDAHVRHAEAFVAAATVEPAVFVDLGSGGGVPGLVLAQRWGDATGWLVDGQLRRVRFLEDAVDELGLVDRIGVRHGRAEDLAHEAGLRASASVVTARSFGPPAITAECGVAFLRPGGVLLVAEPPDGGDDRWPAAPLATLGLVDDGCTRTADGSVRRLRLVGEVPPAIPRRPAAMRRRPTF